jgi:hypothetical protein
MVSPLDFNPGPKLLYAIDFTEEILHQVESFCFQFRKQHWLSCKIVTESSGVPEMFLYTFFVCGADDRVSNPAQAENGVEREVPPGVRRDDPIRVVPLRTELERSIESAPSDTARHP